MSIHQSFSIKALRIYFASWHLPVLIPLQVNCNITYSMSSPRKSVLITGCSGDSIGAALAHVFHGKGYHVFATARNPAKISECLSSAADVTVLTLDVLSSESIAASVESVNKQTGGSLDVLVNNSGGGSYLPALDCSIEKGKKLFDLNFWAPLVMLQAFNDFHGPDLPETSNYNQIRDFLHTTAISSRQYATKVVREIDTGAVGKIWAGTHAFSSRMLPCLAP
jgi:NAD(P)-dependent dehydrogenase (short-subunit alcohol dehydrogenase family)